MLAQFQLSPSDELLIEIEVYGTSYLPRHLHHTIDTITSLLRAREHLPAQATANIVRYTRDALANWRNRPRKWPWWTTRHSPTAIVAEFEPLAEYMNRLDAIHSLQAGLFNLTRYECPNCGHRGARSDPFHFCNPTSVDPKLTENISTWASYQRCVCGHTGFNFNWRFRQWRKPPWFSTGAADREPWIACPACNIELTEEL